MCISLLRHKQASIKHTKTYPILRHYTQRQARVLTEFNIYTNINMYHLSTNKGSFIRAEA